MKLYKTSGEDSLKKDHIVWSGTLADAGKDRKRFKAEGKTFVETSDVDIPTDKNGLLGYLNAVAKENHERN